MDNDIRPLLAAAGVLIAFFTFIFSQYRLARQILLAKTQMEASYKLSLRNKSLTYSIYSSTSLKDARLNIEHYFGKELSDCTPLSIGMIEDYIARDKGKALKSDILTILAHWENMALAIKADVADEQTAYDMVAGTMTRHVTVLHAFLMDRQKINRRAYSNLFWLSRRWRERLEKEDDRDNQYDPVLEKFDRKRLRILRRGSHARVN